MKSLPIKYLIVTITIIAGSSLCQARSSDIDPDNPAGSRLMEFYGLESDYTTLTLYRFGYEGEEIRAFYNRQDSLMRSVFPGDSVSTLMLAALDYGPISGKVRSYRFPREGLYRSYVDPRYSSALYPDTATIKAAHRFIRNKVSSRSLISFALANLAMEIFKLKYKLLVEPAISRRFHDVRLGSAFEFKRTPNNHSNPEYREALDSLFKHNRERDLLKWRNRRSGRWDPDSFDVFIDRYYTLYANMVYSEQFRTDEIRRLTDIYAGHSDFFFPAHNPYAYLETDNPADSVPLSLEVKSVITGSDSMLGEIVDDLLRTTLTEEEKMVCDEIDCPLMQRYQTAYPFITSRILQIMDNNLSKFTRKQNP